MARAKAHRRRRVERICRCPSRCEGSSLRTPRARAGRHDQRLCVRRLSRPGRHVLPRLAARGAPAQRHRGRVVAGCIRQRRERTTHRAPRTAHCAWQQAACGLDPAPAAPRSRRAAPPIPSIPRRWETGAVSHRKVLPQHPQKAGTGASARRACAAGAGWVAVVQGGRAPRSGARGAASRVRRSATLGSSDDPRRNLGFLFFPRTCTNSPAGGREVENPTLQGCRAQKRCALCARGHGAGWCRGEAADSFLRRKRCGARAGAAWCRGGLALGPDPTSAGAHVRTRRAARAGGALTTGRRAGAGMGGARQALPGDQGRAHAFPVRARPGALRAV